LPDGRILRLDCDSGIVGVMLDDWTAADGHRLVIELPDEGTTGPARVVIETTVHVVDLTPENRGFVAMIAGPARKVIDQALHERQSRLVAESLRDETLHDPLTGLLNRRSLSDAPHGLVPAAVLMLDIDHFKAVNDTYGHAIGDVVLRSVADAISECLRRVDTAIRYGGEEFLVLVVLEPGEAGERAVAAVAERIRARVAAVDFSAVGISAPVTVSIGAAVIGPGQMLADVVPRADRALYEAKATGRNRCVLDRDPPL
jgi:diguanylate cyclase (GGDEF)-like protein